MKKSPLGFLKAKLWPQIGGPLLALGAAAAIELLSRAAFKIPNPPAILLLIVVFAAFIGGLRSGLVTALIAWLYFFYFFSIPGQPFHHTEENLRRVIVWAVTTPLMAIMVGMLEQRVLKRTAELGEAKAFLENLIAMSPSVIFKANVKDGIETYFSPNVRRVLGYNPEEIVGVPGWWEDHVHPDDRPTYQTETKAALEQKVTQIEREYRVLHKDSSYRWFHTTARFVYDQSGTPSLFGFGQDVTSRKATEEAVEQAKSEAQRANQAKSEFLSRMSHELRTPLNAIIGFSQLLEMESLSPKQREFVGYILGGGRHLLNLINEVLDIARIEAGRLAISLEPVSVEEVIREALDLIAPLAIEADVRLEDRTGGVPHRVVLADRQRLQQILLNLLSNAVKYNRKGGVVVLSQEELPNGRLQIRVNDTGPGIAPEKLGRLFTPFERLGAEQTVIEGTGLGLALSKHLVEIMGGTIGVETTVGRGSVFWVELAMAAEPETRLERRELAMLAGAQPKTSREAPIVLYVEDNLSNLDLIQSLLAHRPEVRLLPAMQGRLGLDLARQHRPQLILLDLHLPDIGGEDVLQRLREDPETRSIPVVVISADATPGQIDRLLAAGARAYLTKPLDIKRFLVLLGEVLSEGNPGPSHH